MVVYDDYYYFSWWNYLPKKYRYLGPQKMWYDQPHESFGFWFFNWSWSLPWSKFDFDKD